MSAAAFAAHIERELGAAPAVDRLFPGRIVRFSTNGKRSDDSGWAKLFEDARGGVFGDWRSGTNHVWRSTEDDRTPAKYREEVAALQAARAEEQAQRQARAVETAQRIWSRAQPCDHHPYLDRKQVRPDGVRVQFAQATECRGQFRSKGRGGECEPLHGLLLIVPLRDMQWRLQSLQAIDADGRKSFLRGARMHGLFHLLGVDRLRGVDKERLEGPLAVCEGYATGWSIAHDLEQWPCFAAFSAGNLVHVARAVRAQFPRAAIKVCGDSDPSGTGEREAARAADEVRGVAYVPPTLGDWNDVARDLKQKASAR